MMATGVDMCSLSSYVEVIGRHWSTMWLSPARIMDPRWGSEPDREWSGIWWRSATTRVGRPFNYVPRLVDKGTVVASDNEGEASLPRPDDSPEVVRPALSVAEALCQGPVMVER